MAVVDVALGHSTYFLSFPAASKLVSAVFTVIFFFRSTTDSINCICLNLPRSRGCQRGSLHRAFCCSAISRGNNSKGTQVILLVYVQEIVRDHYYYCSAISISKGNNPKDTLTIRNKTFQNIGTTARYDARAQFFVEVHDAELRVFSTHTYTMVSLSFYVCSFVGGALSPP